MEKTKKITIIYKNGRPFLEIVDGCMRTTYKLPAEFTKEDVKKLLEEYKKQEK